MTSRHIHKKYRRKAPVPPGDPQYRAPSAVRAAWVEMHRKNRTLSTAINGIGSMLDIGGQPVDRASPLAKPTTHRHARVLSVAELRTLRLLEMQIADDDPGLADLQDDAE